VHELIIAELLAHSNGFLASFELGNLLGPFGSLLGLYQEVDELFTCNIHESVDECTVVAML